MDTSAISSSAETSHGLPLCSLVISAIPSLRLLQACSSSGQMAISSTSEQPSGESMLRVGRGPHQGVFRVGHLGNTPNAPALDTG